jgi:hypothetical protein
MKAYLVPANKRCSPAVPGEGRFLALEGEEVEITPYWRGLIGIGVVRKIENASYTRAIELARKVGQVHRAAAADLGKPGVDPAAVLAAMDKALLAIAKQIDAFKLGKDERQRIDASILAALDPDDRAAIDAARGKPAKKGE